MNENDSKIRLILDLVGFKGVEIDEAIASLQHVKDTLDDTAAVGTKAEGSTRNFGRATLETGRVIQDVFQGGIGGALNNIEGLSMALGLGGGLAGVLTTLGVLLYAFRPQIESAVEGLGLFADKVEATGDQLDKLKARVKELEAKPIKLAVDTLEIQNAQRDLDRLQAAAKGFEALRGLTTEEQRKAGDRARDVLAKAPGGAQAVADALAAAETRRGTEQSQTLKETEGAIAAAEADVQRLRKITPADLDEAAAVAGRIAAIEEQIGKLQEKRRQTRLGIEEDARRRVGGAFAGASAGRPGDRQALADMLRGVGRGDLADQLEGATPEAVQAAADAADAVKAMKAVKPGPRAEFNAPKGRSSVEKDEAADEKDLARRVNEARSLGNQLFRKAGEQEFAPSPAFEKAREGFERGEAGRRTQDALQRLQAGPQAAVERTQDLMGQTLAAVDQLAQLNARLNGRNAALARNLAAVNRNIEVASRAETLSTNGIG